MRQQYLLCCGLLVLLATVTSIIYLSRRSLYYQPLVATVSPAENELTKRKFNQQSATVTDSLEHGADINVNATQLSSLLKYPGALTDYSHSTHFPQIMIVGFGKAGTKTLFEYLKNHPQLNGPQKEMRFFSQNYGKGLQSYLNALPVPPANGYVIEKSPDYIIVPDAASRIATSAEILGISPSGLKFVIVLRDPIYRTMSEYLEWNVQRKIAKKPSLLPFERMLTTKSGAVNFSVKFINTSCYAYHLRKWLKHFSANQLCFVDGDAFAHSPYAEIHKLESCLKLDTYFTESNFVLNKRRGFYCYMSNNSKPPMCMGKSKGRPHPSIQEDVHKQLAEYFTKWDKELKNITGKTWSWFYT